MNWKTGKKMNKIESSSLKLDNELVASKHNFN
jgi:hypothetical protein